MKQFEHDNDNNGACDVEIGTACQGNADCAAYSACDDSCDD
jgi:hypothetical protein